jgi:hypothetical protein
MASTEIFSKIEAKGSVHSISISPGGCGAAATGAVKVKMLDRGEVRFSLGRKIRAQLACLAPPFGPVYSARHNKQYRRRAGITGRAPLMRGRQARVAMNLLIGD